jgi:hypothetical protein
VVLVVHLSNTDLGKKLGAGSTRPFGLNYVESIDIATAGRGVEVSMTLSKQVGFTTSTSNAPPQLRLAIG